MHPLQTPPPPACWCFSTTSRKAAGPWSLSGRDRALFIPIHILIELWLNAGKLYKFCRAGDVTRGIEYLAAMAALGLYLAPAWVF